MRAVEQGDVPAHLTPCGPSLGFPSSFDPGHLSTTSRALPTVFSFGLTCFTDASRSEPCARLWREGGLVSSI